MRKSFTPLIAFSLTTISLIAISLIAATPVSSQNAATSDYSSGFGFLEDPETPGSVGYQIMGLVPGGEVDTPVRGEFDFRRADRNARGRGFHAEGVCINAEGANDDVTRAVIVVQVEQSTDPAYRVGEFVRVLAVDNVDGNGGAHRGDVFHLDETSSQTPLSCEQDGEETPAPIRGDIVVQNGGFAGGETQ